MLHTLLNITKQLITLTIVVLSMALLGCKSAETIGTVTEAEEPLLVYRKSPCYGPCPAYEATIYSTGKVLFAPFKYTPVTDTITFQLSEKELKKLQTNLDKLNYSKLQKLYKTSWTDMPATHLYFYQSGKEVKHIKHQEGGPEELIRFIDEVHALLWKHVQGK
ncbi:hypothetical protein H7F15_12655 [Pontibacter sp. Tf4]|uniref:DUF6438 domain-containing protein n=1 Tax=Pontibacter sp. Tf4 TaxID=2761620 RepID=UPI00162658A6|nr:DUF6438 domain-containing protein [Pontibacter sp. Tf4]MBB6611894.1 hypothetical protein [Pontibacter sp. Tf4]